ncbi:MAG: hypothetical protein JWM87_1445 [Candidatus Eremiobacteraeota bacterium]|nr:hypothetical protein [Candidatus Eremiobacteraeota bacterium]
MSGRNEILGSTAWDNLLRSRHSRWSDGGGRTGGDPGTAHARIAAGIALPVVTPKFQLRTNDVYFCIGSCFARNIEDHLLYRRLPTLSRQVPFAECSGRLNSSVDKFTTASVLNELRWSLAGVPFPEDSLVEENGAWRDLHLAACAPALSLAEVRERRAQTLQYFGRVRNASVVIITLGSVEAWHDAQAGVMLNAAPTPGLIGRFPGRYSVVVSDYAENVRLLRETYDVLNAFAGDVRIIVTVSPVPMGETFTGRDVIVANTYAKATLRAAAEDSARAYANADYYPSYDAITVSHRALAYNPLDNRHVLDTAVQAVAAQFLTDYGAGGDVEHPEFVELDYLNANSDVRAAVVNKQLASGYDHWLAFGRDEGRPLSVAQRSFELELLVGPRRSVSTRPFDTLDGTLARAEAAIAAGELEAALRLIRSQVEAWFSASALTRNALWGSRELDALAVQLGRIIADLPADASDLTLPRIDDARPLDVYLFTRTEVGAHVAVAGDLVRATPDRTNVVVLTEQPAEPVPAEFAERFATPPERIVCLPRGSLLERTRALIALLKRLRPDRTFLFNHHHDVSIIAAAGSGVLETPPYYVHHADHLPALGTFMADAAHIDLTPRAHTFCSTVLGLPSAYVPLVADDRGRRTPSTATSGARVLATSGSPAKYDLSYRHPYHKVVAALLARTGATLYHIGPLFDEQVSAIRGALTEAGADEARWRHIAFVPSVWQAMDDLAVDLYINSFPQRGGRVAVEVMGSGTPAVWHASGPRYQSVDLHLAYPEAEAWADAGELIEIVRRIDAPWFEAQANAARSHYEKVHHPALLVQTAAAGFRGAPLPASSHERLYAFEFEHLERSWHGLTKLIPPQDASS